MQQALFSQTPISQAPPQAIRVVHRRVEGLEARASNDDSFQEDERPWRMVFSILANVVGGAILLYGMFILPHIIAKILS